MSRQEKISTLLQTELKPIHLEVVNESYLHNTPPEAESHFRIVVVSDLFNGKSLVEQHRMVNTLLQTDLAGTLHALSLRTLTPAQWQNNPAAMKSPACRGGEK